MPIGQGQNTASIYSRGGTNELLPLGNIVEGNGVTGLAWGRVLNDVSLASVTITGTPQGIDVSALSRIRSWAYELVIFRDGVRQWEGPIRSPQWTRTGMVIPAFDVAGWLSRRKISKSRKTKTPHTVTAEMELAVRRALAPADPHVLDFLAVVHHASEAQITRDVANYSGYYLDDLKSLAEQGGNFTTVGRRLLLWPDQALIGRLETLDTERDITADITVTEDGDSLWTKTTAVNQNGRAASKVALNADVNAAGVSAVYGLHDRRIDGGDTKRLAALAARARRAQNRSYPAPLVLEIPAGAALNPAAPFEVAQLVPGVIVPSVSNGTAVHVSQPMVLSKMDVTVTAEAGESVTVDLINPAADSEDGV